MELNYREIGRRIKALRLSKNILQTELAGILCISQTHMSNIECGRTGLTLENLVKMAEVFQCSIDKIVFGKAAAGNNLQDYSVDDFAKAWQILQSLKSKEQAN